MANKKKFPLWAQILVGLIIGSIIGLIWPKFGASLQPIGKAFIKAIKMIVIPLVFSAVTLGIYKVSEDVKLVGRMAAIAIGWFFLATTISGAIGITLNAIFHPAAGITFHATGKLPQNLATSVNWTEFFLDLIPDNVINAMANQKVLPTLIFAIFFGFSLGAIGEKAKVVVNVLEGVQNAMFKLTGGVIATAPIAVAAIMAWAFATQDKKILLGMVKLVGVMYIGLLVVMVLFCILVFFVGENPFRLLRSILAPLLLGFTTSSSEVTLPVHMEILVKKGIPERVVSFVLPLGYSFNLDGSALYQALAVTFIAELYGYHLPLPALLSILLTTVIANKGTANVPAASLVVVSVILSNLGLPLEAMTMLFAVDRFMDMGRTAVNVFGNTMATILVDKWSGRFPSEKTELVEGAN